ncbi:ATP-grasp domain-containing protein [Nakamurella sp. A5-74]|uniref:ATP-grasp domain-containing protein n=1 Tax=Nakamurella sp. A5-74 TaxID=3158264 RepID=A0AAU8DKV9_9ACTN
MCGQLSIALLEAPNDWLATLPSHLTGRRIVLATIAEAWTLRGPAFMKSPNDKSIAARVHLDGTRLPGPDEVDPETPVLVSDVVTFAEEVRLHVLDGDIRAARRYALSGRLAIAPASADALAFGKVRAAGTSARSCPWVTRRPRLKGGPQPLADDFVPVH